MVWVGLVILSGLGDQGDLGGLDCMGGLSGLSDLNLYKFYGCPNVFPKFLK